MSSPVGRLLVARARITRGLASLPAEPASGGRPELTDRRTDVTPGGHGRFTLVTAPVVVAPAVITGVALARRP